MVATLHSQLLSTSKSERLTGFKAPKKLLSDIMTFMVNPWNILETST